MSNATVVIMQEILAVHQKRYNRCVALAPSTVAADELDVLYLNVLNAKLNLTREQERQEVKDEVRSNYPGIGVPDGSGPGPVGN